MSAASCIAAPAPPIEFSQHACERWQLRARRRLPLEQVAAELERMTDVVGTMTTRRRAVTGAIEPVLRLGQFRFPLVALEDGRHRAVTCINERPSPTPAERTCRHRPPRPRTSWWDHDDLDHDTQQLTP